MSIKEEIDESYAQFRATELVKARENTAARITNEPILETIEHITKSALNIIQENKELRNALIKCRDTLDEIRMDRVMFPLWCENQIEAIEIANRALGENDK